jgi:hypothetical protein
MASFAIVLGFAFMLLLPCAAAFLGSRERKEDSGSAYADRSVDRTKKAEAPEVSAGTLPSQQAEPVELVSSAPAAPFPWGDPSDPETAVCSALMHQGRVERAELEAIQARAVAARAHAEALAATARAAAVKAEAAAAHAEALERDAMRVMQVPRRAA